MEEIANLAHGFSVALTLPNLGFMRQIGRFSWLLTLCISVALPILIYVTFERWFLVPLPKGPIEDWLGL